MSRRWGTAADASIGRTLSNFLVHDVHDMRLLQGMSHQCGDLGKHLSIVIINFDVPSHQMHPGKLPPKPMYTLADALTCPASSGTAVMNALVDNVRAAPLFSTLTRGLWLPQPNPAPIHVVQVRYCALAGLEGRQVLFAKACSKVTVLCRAWHQAAAVLPSFVLWT